MAGIPSDYTIIGLVLAISIAIILLAGLALYVSFRVRDTMREEKGRGARAAKVGLLIGLLFLAGGVFFFFASGINANNGSASTTTSISSSSLSTSTSATTSTAASSTTATSTSTSSGGAVSMNIQCPTSGGSVTAGGSFTCTVTIYNLGTSAYQGATLVSSGDLSQFAFQSCSMTINGIQASCTVPSTTEISIGSISPGTTLLTLGLAAPSTNGQKSCTITLAASGMAQPLATTFTIQVIK